MHWTKLYYKHISHITCRQERRSCCQVDTSVRLPCGRLSVRIPVATDLSVIYLSIEYRIKMRLQRLIYNINKLVLNLYFGFKVFIRKLEKSLCTSLIVRIKSILMIDMHKNVIRYQIEHGFYVNKNVNNATSLLMARISLIDEKRD